MMKKPLHAGSKGLRLWLSCLQPSKLIHVDQLHVWIRRPVLNAVDYYMIISSSRINALIIAVLFATVLVDACSAYIAWLRAKYLSHGTRAIRMVRSDKMYIILISSLY